MHPILARGRRLALYLLLFLQAGWLLAEIMVRLTEVPRSTALLLLLPVVLLHAFSCLASWYLCRSLTLGGTPAFRLVVSHGVAGLFATGMMLGAGWRWALVLTSSLGLESALEAWVASLSWVAVFGGLLYSLAVAVHYLLLAREASRAARQQALEAELLAQGAELRALKAQLDPHFLFNSLNSIASLVSGDPGQARQMCIRLASFLRRSLEVGKHDRIALADELKLVDHYLEVEQIRFGDRLRVERLVGPGCGSCLLPPLLLQPLVENAVRHGVAHLVEGGTIELTADCHEDRLRLRIENPLDPERSRRSGAGSGIGLDNVKRRLEMSYGEHGQLRVQTSADRFRAVITLPAQRQAAIAAPAAATEEKNG